MNLVLLGAPASGKGTQAKLLSQKLNMLHISTGDIFRENMKNRTSLGMQIESFMKNATLVPDEITINAVKNKIEENANKNLLFDGFPRTVAQAEQLEVILPINFAILIESDLSVLIKRASERKVCSKCGAVYSTKTYFNKKCKNCDVDLTVRSDDNAETVTKRFNEYIAQTLPVADYYKNLGKLIVVNGNNTIENVFEDIMLKIEDVV